MKHYSVKMSDGTRYDFDGEGMKEREGFLLIENKSKTIWLNNQHIVSVTVSKGDGDDSKAIS